MLIGLYSFFCRVLKEGNYTCAGWSVLIIDFMGVINILLRDNLSHTTIGIVAFGMASAFAPETPGPETCHARAKIAPPGPRRGILLLLVPIVL